MLEFCKNICKHYDYCSGKSRPRFKQGEDNLDEMLLSKTELHNRFFSTIQPLSLNNLTLNYATFQLFSPRKPRQQICDESPELSFSFMSFCYINTLDKDSWFYTFLSYN